MDLNYKKHVLIGFCGILLFCIQGCTNVNDAPVVDDGMASTLSDPNHYRVKADDNLMSIAFAFGQDYRKLAAINHISPPYAIHAGQVLVVSGMGLSSSPLMNGEKTILAPMVSTRPSAPVALKVRPKQTTGKPVMIGTVQTKGQPAQGAPINGPNPSHWLWPAEGNVINTFSPNTGNKGINIANKPGSPIYAASAGEVVYAGSGLSGYGKLIIIKHDEEYLSAYADNSQIFVKEGDRVKAKQRIAKMGNMLHFEIRRTGKPVDPLQFLSKR